MWTRVCLVSNTPLSRLLPPACSKKLGVDPSDKRIVLTEPPMNPSINRERMLQIMFEKYNFKAVYVGIQAMLTLYAQGEASTHADTHRHPRIRTMQHAGFRHARTGTQASPPCNTGASGSQAVRACVRTRQAIRRPPTPSAPPPTAGRARTRTLADTHRHTRFPAQQHW